jgi:hypothetical protein
LFGSMNVHLKGQKFQTDNKVAWSGYAVRIKLCMVLSSVTCQDDGNMY